MAANNISSFLQLFNCQKGSIPIGVCVLLLAESILSGTPFFPVVFLLLGSFNRFHPDTFTISGALTCSSLLLIVQKLLTTNTNHNFATVRVLLFCTDIMVYIQIIFTIKLHIIFFELVFISYHYILDSLFSFIFIFDIYLSQFIL